MGSRLSGLGSALYNSKRKEFLGRDGAGWGKLGVFYFFFYLGLAGFFCAMLAVFMALSPSDRPRYYSESSRMRTRSHPLSPGLGFRPQPEVDKNLILVKKHSSKDQENPFAKNLDQYLQVYYWKKDLNSKPDNDEGNGEVQEKPKFVINNPDQCTSASNYGYSSGKPCVLVKMNKVVGYEPKPLLKSGKDVSIPCNVTANAIPVHCYGEYPADVDNIGPLNYISENGRDEKCGSLDTKWFPYEGKSNRQDVYQAPYIWVQFLNPKPNVLINVLCRIYGQNIEFDKKTARALTRFQLYVEDLSSKQSSSRSET
jgi:sodium/potassium-transporting ATPase subunit beta